MCLVLKLFMDALKQYLHLYVSQVNWKAQVVSLDNKHSREGFASVGEEKYLSAHACIKDILRFLFMKSSDKGNVLSTPFILHNRFPKGIITILKPFVFLPFNA